MDFNRFFNNQELAQQLNTWAKTYPNLISIEELGRSYNDQPIYLVILTSKKTGADRDKPAIWADANIHATEVAGTTTLLAFIYDALTKYGKEERFTSILDSSTFYLVPRLNPDGAALALAKKPQYVRSGVRNYPYEDRGEGIHEEDIDNDGRLLQMRIPDPNGDWKISSLDKRLMQKRGADENGGEYFRLFPEGLIEEWDGYQIKVARPQQSLDFNRNFPGEWRPESAQHGAGPYPTSEREVRAMVDFISHHPNINIALTYHTYSGVILRPYDTLEDDRMETDDLWVYKKLGSRGTELTGYPCVSVYHDFRYHPKEVITGTFDQWIFDHFGMFSFTVELWDIVGEAGIKERKFIEWFRDHPHEQDVQILKWVEEHAPKGYVEWYKFEHPQLGTVELGGWDRMYTWRNPPASHMAKEAEKNLPFLWALSDTLPHLSIYKLEVKKLGESDYWINLVVENTGFLPTYTSQQGRKRNAMRVVRAELELPDGITVVGGKRLVELGHLEGRSNKLAVSSFGYGESPTDNRTRAEWVLNAKPGSKFAFKLESERAGVIRREVVLE